MFVLYNLMYLALKSVNVSSQSPTFSHVLNMEFNVGTPEMTSGTPKRAAQPYITEIDMR